METPYLPADPSFLEREKEEKEDEILLEPGKMTTLYRAIRELSKPY